MWLYYTSTKINSDFRIKPPGRPDFTRLIQGQPWWQTLTTIESPQKKKTLILADWRSQFWNSNQLSAIQDALKRLCDEGFELYCWNGMELETVSANAISQIKELSQPYSQNPLPQHDLKALALKQLKKAPETLQILDDYWLDRLLDQDMGAPRIIDTHLYNLHPKPWLVRSLLQSKSSVHSEIVFNTFPPKAISLPSSLQLPYRTKLQHAELNENDIRELQSVGSISKRLNRFELLFSTTDIAGLKSLKLANYIITEPSSESVNFISSMELSSLETFSLYCARITDTQLNHLLTRMPKLKELELFNLPKLSMGAFEGINLDSIEQFTTRDLTDTPLSTLFLRMPRLKMLDVISIKNLSVGDLEGIKLDALEQLSLPNVTDPQLITLLVRTPYLKKLRLEHDYFSSEELKGINLDFLEEFILFSNNITDTQFNNLLAKMPNLKKLNVVYCTNLSIGSFEGINLDSLEELALPNIKDMQLNTIIAKIPKLKKLDLSSWKSNSIGPLENINLNALEELILPGITDESLYSILEKMPRLRKLVMCSTCKSLLSDTLKDMSLDSLEEFKINAKDITDTELNALLKKMPNLKKLDVSYCKNISIDAFKNINLSVLEEFSSHASIPINELQNLLNDMSNLRKLNSGAHEGDPIELKLPESLEIHDYLSIDHVSNTPYNPHYHQSYSPTPPDFNFSYKEKQGNTQDVIIERLSQYWVLTGQHQNDIYRIQDGICNALSYFFTQEEQLKITLTAITAWDGTEEKLTDDLKEIFNRLTLYVVQYQFAAMEENAYLIELKNLPILSSTDMPLILRNSWHAVTVKQNEWGEYLFYDPNKSDTPIVCQSMRKLKERLESSLGYLILVPGKNPSSFRRILDIGLGPFLRHGGLLAGALANNKTQIMRRYFKNNEFDIQDLTPEEINGILLRNTNGVPAWMVALEIPELCDFTERLMDKFKTHYPNDWESRLRKSASEIRVDKFIKHQVEPGLPPPVKEQKPLFRKQSNSYRDLAQEQYLLLDWIRALNQEKETLPSQTPLFHQHVLNNDMQRRTLLTMENPASRFSAQLALEQYCQDTHQPVFWINSPDDLICSAPYIQKGTYHKGPGGPLHEFLMANQHTKPVILVNYDRFKPEDIIRCHNLLDDNGAADGTKLPEGSRIVGFYTSNRENAYTGSDFFSRFDRILPHQAQSVDTYEPLASEAPSTEEGITLYPNNDWRTALLGYWTVHKDKMVYEEGLLSRAINEGKALWIALPLYQSVEFQEFWQRTLSRKKVDTGNGLLNIPDDLILRPKETYNWPVLKERLVSDNNRNMLPDIVLNPHTLERFFKNYEIEDEQFLTLPGLLDVHKGKTLRVYLTRDLGESEWARLLEACQKKQVTLHCQVAPSVTPLDKLELLPCKAKKVEWNHEVRGNPLIIESTDRDVTLAQITKNTSNWLVIDISEYEASDLLEQIDSHFDEDNILLRFQKTENILSKALKEKRNVILTGRFSRELQDQLAPLLCRTHSNPQLVLIAEQHCAPDYCAIQTHFVTEDEKKEVLFSKLQAEEQQKILPYIGQFSLVQLQAILRQEAPWQGMKALDVTIPDTPINLSNSKKIADSFIESRHKTVLNTLSLSPFVFIGGLSGVGKSTFVTQHIHNYNGTKVYQGEKNIQEWIAHQDGDGMKILFIDEANLSEKCWSEIEGLFQTPPGIVVNGQYHPLTNKHKVIFAGNPLSYGGRQLAPLFERHGNALVFSPMPPEFIYERILKPVFDDMKERDIETLCLPILQTYQQICADSTKQILISPRELQMIALLVRNYHKNHSEVTDDILQIAVRHYIHQITYGLGSARLQATLDSALVPRTLPDNVASKDKCNGFLITESRQPLNRMLNEWLDLRLQRTNEYNNQAQRYGGLGGIVIEGDSGIGKSDIVIEILRRRGFKETFIKTDIHEPSAKNHFYKMPASMQLEDKKALLLKAFHEGAVVIADEINSSPMIEQLMNHLLTGETPEGERPKIPGFMIIGTQNPPLMGHRFISSEALDRRMHKIALPPYTSQEMIDILISKGIEKNTAESMVHAFKIVQEQTSPSKTPPNFRDLIKLAKNHLRAFNVQKEYSSEIAETITLDETSETITLDKIFKPDGSAYHAEQQSEFPRQQQPRNQNNERAQQQAKREFENQFRLLDEKIEDLKTRRNKMKAINDKQYKELNDAYKAAKTLKINLIYAAEKLIAQPSDAQYRTFKESCNRYFRTAHQQLDKHRGWSEFLTNLALGIATAGVGLLIKGIVNMFNNRSFFFVHKTDSSQILDELEEKVRLTMQSNAKRF